EECRSGRCADASCVPETDAELCAALGRRCGAAQTIDRCGTTRPIVSCGTGDEGSCVEGTCETCTAESDEACCARLGKDCGSVTDADNCGTARTASCGTCEIGENCGAAGPNVCGSGTCPPESDAQFCARLGRDCGSVTNFDNCGTARTVSFCGEC